MIRMRQGYPVTYIDTLYERQISDEAGDILCMAMEMYNLAEPRWIKIDCNKNNKNCSGVHERTKL